MDHCHRYIFFLVAVKIPIKIHKYSLGSMSILYHSVRLNIFPKERETNPSL